MDDGGPLISGMNWSNYCSNDPVNYLDPLGLTIKAESGATPEEKEALGEALESIESTKRGTELVENLQDPDVQVTVYFTDKDEHYDPVHNQVGWDPSVALNTNQGLQTPAVALAHELGHAEQDLKGEKLDGLTTQEYNKMENENLKNTETPIAKELGLPTRSDYYDYDKKDPLVETIGVNSSTPKQEAEKLTEEIKNWVDPPMTRYGLPGPALYSQEKVGKKS